MVFGTESLSNRDGKSAGNTIAETNGKESDGTCGANGSEGADPQGLTDDNCINKTVELLEEHSNKNRDHESQNQAHGVPFGQFLACIFCHDEKTP